MATEAPPDGVIRMAVNYDFVGAECTNVFTLFTTSTSPTPEEYVTLIGTYVTNCISLLIDKQSTGLSVVTCIASVSDGTGIVTYEQGFSIIHGAHEGTPLDASSSPVLSWQGDWHYRGGKPRNYIPGATTDRLHSPQLWELSYTASLAADAIDYIDAVAGLPSENPAFDTVTAGALIGNTEIAAGTFAPYAGVVVRRNIGSQRRRLRN